MSETVKPPIAIDFTYYPVREAYQQGLAAPYRSDHPWGEEDNPYLPGTGVHDAWLQGYRYTIEELSE